MLYFGCENTRPGALRGLLGLGVGRILRLVGFGLIQDLLGDETQDQLFGDRRDARDRHLAQQSLDVILLRVAEPTESEDRLQAGVISRTRAQELPVIRLR